MLICRAAEASPTAVPASKVQASKGQAAGKAEWVALKKSAEAAYLEGDMARAEEKYRSAVVAAGASKDDGAKIVCLTALSNCLAAQNDKLKDEEPLRRQTLELAKNVYGEKSAPYARALAAVADLKARQGEIADSADTVERAMSILGQSDEKYPLEMAVCYQAIANRESARGSFGLADDAFKKALDLRTAKLPATDPDLLDTCKCYAEVLNQLGRKDEANKLQERISLAKVTSSVAAQGSASSGGKKADSNKAALFLKLLEDAKAANQAKDRDRSLSCWKLVAAEAEKSAAKDGRLPYALVHLGDAYSYNMQRDEAAALYKRAMDLRGQNGSDNTLGAARNLSRIASSELSNKHSAEAARLYSKVVEIEQHQNAPDTVQLRALQHLVSACMASKENGKAEEAAKRMASLADKVGGPIGTMQKNFAIGMLGSLYMQSGRTQEGLQLMKSMAGAARANPGDIGKALQDSFQSDEAFFDKAEEESFTR